MRKSLINQDMYRNHFCVTVVESKSSQNVSQGGIVFFWLREPYLFLKKKTLELRVFLGKCIHKPLVQPFVPDITQCQGCLCFNIFPTNRRQPGHPKLPGIQYSRAQIMPQKSVVFCVFKDGQNATKNSWRIGGWTKPFGKICSSQIGSSSQLGLKIQKYLKPPPSWAKVDLIPKNLDSFLKRE